MVQVAPVLGCRCVYDLKEEGRKEHGNGWKGYMGYRVTRLIGSARVAVVVAVGWFGLVGIGCYVGVWRVCVGMWKTLIVM